MVNFYHRLSTILASLYRLLNKGVDWNWSSAQETAFKKSKELLTSANLLTHFDPDLPLVLACDASAYGIGAVLAHQMSDGMEKTITYALRTLNSAEHNYY